MILFYNLQELRTGSIYIITLLSDRIQLLWLIYIATYYIDITSNTGYSHYCDSAQL